MFVARRCWLSSAVPRRRLLRSCLRWSVTGRPRFPGCLSEQASHSIWERLLESVQADEELSIAELTSAISACGRGLHWRLAAELLQSRLSQSLPNSKPTVATYNAMIDACACSGQWEQAVAWLHNLQWAQLQPAVITYNSLINACGSKQWRKAVHFFQRIAAEGLKPTAITVSSLANTNRRRGAPSLLALCHVVAVRPDVVLCNTQLRSYQRELRWQQAVRVLQEVFERFALQADEVSYATCISALELSHQWPLAVRLLERMRAQEIPPSLVAYNATMATCESSSQWERTLSLFQTLRDDGLQPTQVTGDVLQMACEADSKWRFAVELAVRTPYGSAGAAGLVSCCEAALAAGPVIRAVPSVAGKVSEQLQRQKTSSLFAVFRHSAVQLLLQSSVLWWRLLSRLQTALEDEGLLANIVLNSAAARVLLSESAASGAIVPGDRTCQELASAHWLPRAPRMGLLPVVLESVSVTSGDWSIAMGPARWFGLLCLIRRGGSTAFVEPEKSPSPEKDLADIWWSIPSVGYMH